MLAHAGVIDFALSSKNFLLFLSNSIEVKTEFDFQLLGFWALKTVEVRFSAAHEQLLTDRLNAIK